MINASLPWKRLVSDKHIARRAVGRKARGGHIGRGQLGATLTSWGAPGSLLSPRPNAFPEEPIDKAWLRWSSVETQHAIGTWLPRRAAHAVVPGSVYVESLAIDLVLTLKSN